MNQYNIVKMKQSGKTIFAVAFEVTPATKPDGTNWHHANGVFEILSARMKKGKISGKTESEIVTGCTSTPLANMVINGRAKWASEEEAEAFTNAYCAADI